MRPWRRATLAASLVAAVELVLLLVCAALLVAKPLTHALRDHARKAAATVHNTPAPVVHTTATHAAVAVNLPPRSHTKVLVLNGNGENGAAHAEATRLEALGYRIAGAANAAREDYATTLVMYAPGFRPQAERLARDLHVQVVGPLDGMRPKALDGGQLAVVLGAS